MKKALLLLTFLSLVGCITPNYIRSHNNIKQGMIVAYMDRRAFVNVWGLPDRTAPVLGEVIIGWAASSEGVGVVGGVIDSKKIYDAWKYEKRGIQLFFDGRYLMYWVTDRTREQLAAPPNETKQDKIQPEYQKGI